MSDKYEDIDLTDEYLRALLDKAPLLSLERALIEEVISVRADVESKSEIGHAVSDAWRDAYDDAQREIAALRAEYSTWHPSVVHDCCVAVQQVKTLGDTVERQYGGDTGMANLEAWVNLGQMRAALHVEHPTTEES